MSETTIHSIVKKAEQNLLEGNVKIGEYVDWSMHDTIETIIAYLNSKHTSGSVDSLGRDKPFFNIVSAAVNIWYRATDLDRKDVVVLPSKSSDVVAAFLATVKLQDWMKRNQFGVFLNQWGRTLAQYGSAVVKFTEKDGQLIPAVVPWNKLIVDPVDFDALPRIEKFYKTPSQLRDMATPGHPNYAGYDMQAVEEIETGLKSRENLRGEKIDNYAEFVELYEVHGNLPLSMLTGKDKDENTYRQQMHVICEVRVSKKDTMEFTLYKGKEAKDPYMITHLIEEDGRTLAIGAVEYLFDAQWMVNHSMKQWKDQMDLASKLIFQTADTSFLGKNVLTNIENGQILTHSVNNPLTQVQNSGHDITSLQAFSGQWQALSRELTSTPDAVRGNTLPSGTPYSLGEYTGSQALSLFEIMTENKGNYLEKMLREHIIPFLKKGLNNKDEIASILDDHNIKKIDAMFVPKAAIRNYNKKTIDAMLKLTPEDMTAGNVPSPFDQQAEEAGVRQQMAEMGNQRFISPGEVTWKEVFEDLEWDLDVGITNEQSDKQAVLTSMSSVLQTIASNPMVLQDPNAKMVFNKIMSYGNVVSPIELSTAAAAPVPAPVAAPQP